jgi:hypothetical protein
MVSWLATATVSGSAIAVTEIAASCKTEAHTAQANNSGGIPHL